MEHLIEIGKVFGVPAMLIIFFIYRDWKREESLSARLSEIEDYQREKLETLITESNNIIKDNSNAMKELCIVLSERPCLSNGSVQKVLK